MKNRIFQSTKTRSKKETNDEPNISAIETYAGKMQDTGGSQARGDCPFIDCAGEKFYANIETGNWDCKHCGRSGNIYGFFQEYYEQCLFQTKDEDLKHLADAREYPIDILKANGIAYDSRLDQFVLPVTATSGQIINLKRAVPLQNDEDPEDLTIKWYGASSVPAGIWNLHEVVKSRFPVWICEGEWDGIIMRWLMGKLEQPFAVCAIPGAKQYRESWNQFFRDRIVILAFDNDKDGYEGLEKTGFLLQGIASKVMHVSWPSHVPDGHDMEDLILAGGVTNQKNLKETWKGITNITRPYTSDQAVSSSNVELFDETPPPVSEVIHELEDNAKVTEDMKVAFKLAAATVISGQLPGDPLWIFLIGPPGLGKTMLLQGFAGSPLAVYQSRIRPRTLVSGYDESGVDPSLIPRLKGKCLVAKDFTEMLHLSGPQKDDVYGILRGAYDGRVEVSFANGADRVYTDCWFSIVAAVTNEIYRERRSNLGERFLRYEMDKSDFKDEEHVAAAIDRDMSLEARDRLADIVARFTARKIDPDNLPKLPKRIQPKLIALARITARLRSEVSRTGDEIDYRPRGEVATRLVQQFLKLGRCLAIIENKKSIDDGIFEILQRVAVDTAIGWNFDIVSTMYRERKQGPFPVEWFLDEVVSSRQTLDRRLLDLTLHGVIERIRDTEAPSTAGGRPRYLYRLTKDTVQIYAKSGLDKFATEWEWTEE